VDVDFELRGDVLENAALVLADAILRATATTAGLFSRRYIVFMPIVREF
jgi:hypothetical protein